MTSPRPGTAIVSLTVNSNRIFDQDNRGLQLLENSGERSFLIRLHSTLGTKRAHVSRFSIQEVQPHCNNV